jgi:hypothetical protein
MMAFDQPKDAAMTIRPTGIALALALVTTCLPGTTSAIAQPASSEPTYGQSSPEAARAALNRQQAEDARRQLADNAASAAASQAATLAREDQIRSDQAAWEAEKARLASDHAAAMDQWRADVAACRAGDRTRCRHR